METDTVGELNVSNDDNQTKWKQRWSESENDPPSQTNIEFYEHGNECKHRK